MELKIKDSKGYETVRVKFDDEGRTIRHFFDDYPEIEQQFVTWLSGHVFDIDTMYGD